MIGQHTQRKWGERGQATCNTGVRREEKGIVAGNASYQRMYSHYQERHNISVAVSPQSDAIKFGYATNVFPLITKEFGRIWRISFDKIKLLKLQYLIKIHHPEL